MYQKDSFTFTLTPYDRHTRNMDTQTRGIYRQIDRQPDRDRITDRHRPRHLYIHIYNTKGGCSGGGGCSTEDSTQICGPGQPEAEKLQGTISIFVILCILSFTCRGFNWFERNWYTYIHIHTYIYILYIYIYMFFDCLFVCVSISICLSVGRSVCLWRHVVHLRLPGMRLSIWRCSKTMPCFLRCIRHAHVCSIAWIPHLTFGHQFRYMKSWLWMWFATPDCNASTKWSLATSKTSSEDRTALLGLPSILMIEPWDPMSEPRVPKSTQDLFKIPQGRAKIGQQRPKSTQERAKSSPRGPKSETRAFKSDPGEANI